MATPATVIITERNGAPAGSETTITNTNMVNVDAVNQTVSKTTAITAGGYSYEKWQRYKVTAFNDATDIGGFKAWASAALTGSDVHKTNARIAGFVNSAYAQPIATASTLADQVMPISEPASANVGIGGSLTATLATGGGPNQYSDYLIHQVAVNAATTVGKSITMNYQYDEYA